MEYKRIKLKFSDFVELKRGYDLPTKDRNEGCIPIISSSGKSGNHNLSKVKGPGVITGRSGLIGVVHYESKDFWPLNTTLYVKDFKGNNPRYVYYFLKNMKLKNYQTGSSVPTLNRNHLNNLEVTIHDKCIQAQQIKVLKNLDDKIELNQKIIANLEELSQTLFKRWFVDFEFPDENGSPYQSSGGEMVESELGEIPKGWGVSFINDFANNNVITGKTPSTKVKENYSEAGIPFLTIPDMHHDIFVINTARYISEKGMEKLASKVLPVNSLSVSCIATPGLVSITSEDTLTNQQINSFTPTKKYLYYLYFYLKSLKDYIRELGSGGSATLNLNKTQFSKIKLMNPKEELVIKYHQLVAPYFEMILKLQNEVIKLTELRDTLLPKLMSGELEILDEMGVDGDALSI